MNVVSIKKKREKAEDFVGWVSPDGNLKVVELVEKSKHSKYKVVCKICSEDKELFPLGYFISTKQHLLNGSKPCGCSVKPEWSLDQFLILVKRVSTANNFNIIGLAEEFFGQHTKLKLECKIDGHRWLTSFGHIMNSGSGCPKCAGNVKYTEQEALIKCEHICDNFGYKIVGFPDGYKNCYSRFEYICPLHGKHNVSYDRFIHGNTICPSCSTSGYTTDKSGTFYIVRWYNELDSFIKFGKTNRKIISRIKQQKRKTVFKYEIIFQQTWKDGGIADLLEKSVKSSNLFEIGIIEKFKFIDGYTETICVQDTDKLLNYIQTQISKIEEEQNSG